MRSLDILRSENQSAGMITATPLRTREKREDIQAWKPVTAAAPALTGDSLSSIALTFRPEKRLAKFSVYDVRESAPARPVFACRS